MHQLHHSRAERHKFCNYGVVFSLWDRWFRTHIDEAVPPDVEFGTASDHVPTGNPHSLVQLYLAPFRLESQSINKGQRS
jgi:sterol desaturase/sphingolipid hydroxylase (fatty acid hydroxylase superfamily)